MSACGSPYSIENLAILREKLVLATLTERNGHKLLKSQCKNYTAQQLIQLDSCFFMMYMGAAKNTPRKSSAADPRNQSQYPKIFAKIIRDFLMDDACMSRTSDQDKAALLRHYILLHQEPVQNLMSDSITLEAHR